MRVTEALANADRSLEGKFANEPRVEASVRESLAKVYQELGEYQKAEGHAARAFALREQALGPEHEATLRAMHTLGWSRNLLGQNGKDEQTESLYRRMLEICRRTRNDDDELTLDAMNGLAMTLRRRSTRANAATDLAGILGRRAQLDEATRLRQRVLDASRRTKRPEDPQNLNVMINQALTLVDLEKWTEAEPLLRQVLEINVKNHPDDLRTLIYMVDYAWLLSRLSRIAEAADWAVRSMDAYVRVLKLKHPDTRAVVGMAIRMKMADQKFVEALAIADRAVAQARRELGPDDLGTMNYLSMRVNVLRGLGDLEQARKGALEVLAARAKKQKPVDPEMLSALASLADIRRHQGAIDEAKTLFARLHDAAQGALVSNNEHDLDHDLLAEIKWAEMLSRNLGVSGRSDRSALAPGTPGGPPRIIAPFQARSPVTDGRIEPAEYGDGAGMSFDFAHDPNPQGSYLGDIPGRPPKQTKDPSDLSVQMHAVHTAKALFLAFRVRDQSVRATPAAAHTPWLNDCVEVYFDGDRMANDWTPAMYGGSREGFKVGADALGNQFFSSIEIQVSRWKAAANRTEDGYLIEFEVPLDLIDTQDGPGFHPATTGAELRMNMNILDYDDSGGEQSSYGLLWAEDRQWSLNHGGEDFWAATLVLAPAREPDH
jgi:tetratricopeptide (TPR) repeat protein